MTPAMLLNRLRSKLGREQVFKITINYVSGTSETFKCHAFSITPGFAGTKTYDWTSARNHRPLHLSPGSIESVYQEDTF